MGVYISELSLIIYEMLYSSLSFLMSLCRFVWNFITYARRVRPHTDAPKRATVIHVWAFNICEHFVWFVRVSTSRQDNKCLWSPNQIIAEAQILL